MQENIEMKFSLLMCMFHYTYKELKDSSEDIWQDLKYVCF